MAGGVRLEIDGTTTVYRDDSRTLDEARAEALAHIAREYAAQIARGVVFSGKLAQIDPASVLNMNSMLARAKASGGLPADFAWRMADNTFLPMTATALEGLGIAASDRVLALRKAMWTAVDAARVAKTRDEVDAIKAAWPK